jgi:hypothetical protein
MRVNVTYQDEQLELEVPDDRLVAAWEGPAGASGAETARMVAEALERPREYPPLKQSLVPGDRVVIAFDAELPHPRAVLEPICEALRGAGVDAGAIAVLVPLRSPALPAGSLPEGVVLETHDPEDRTHLAYLASTKEGRRIYLNRLLTDADFVLPVGRIRFDRVLGCRGPWSTIFPDLSDQETLRAFQAGTQAEGAAEPAALRESGEVSWLLGSQFHLGLVEGVAGPTEVVAGQEANVREQGMRALERAWSFPAESRADLVVAGIGRPGAQAGLEELADGLATAARLVRRSGKIVALTRVQGEFGPSVLRLAKLDDPRLGPSALRGHEADADYAIARSLATTLSWADVYLLSGLDPDAVEDLGMIGLERSTEARRLVAACPSCLVVSGAERTRALVADES